MDKDQMPSTPDTVESPKEKPEETPKEAPEENPKEAVSISTEDLLGEEANIDFPPKPENPPTPDNPTEPEPTAPKVEATIEHVKKCRCRACLAKFGDPTEGRQHKQGRHPKGCMCEKCLGQSTGAKTASEGNAPNFDDLGKATSGSKREQFMVSAGGIFDFATTGLGGMVGPEWQPQSAEERAMVVGALAKYLESKDLPDLPPGWALVAVCCIYAAPRFKAQPTRSKVKATWHLAVDKVKKLFNWFKRNKKGKTSNDKPEGSNNN